MAEQNSRSAFVPDPPEGENVNDADLTITRQWLDFYAELITFEEQVLASMVHLAEGLRPEARARAEESNLIPIQYEVQQLHVRRAAWQRRRQELEG
jgi:hypothetical protein